MRPGRGATPSPSWERRSQMPITDDRQSHGCQDADEIGGSSRKWAAVVRLRREDVDGRSEAAIPDLGGGPGLDELRLASERELVRDSVEDHFDELFIARDLGRAARARARSIE